MAAAEKAVATVAPTQVAVPQFTFEAMQKMAKSMADSKLFGLQNADQALSLMLVAQAEGRHPALAARDYHIIHGRPSLKADTMLSRFQASGGSVVWAKYDEKQCVGTFAHPQGGKVTVTWTIEMARDAGLLEKNGTWKQYPRAMLRARCVSEGVRTVFPGVAVGIYTPEEIQDGVEEIDVTPVSVERAIQDAGNVSTALTVDEIEAHVNAMAEAETTETLKAAFSAAYAHAKQAKDKAARDRFKAVYELRKEHVGKEAT
jgi:hypothetical protein